VSYPIRPSFRTYLGLFLLALTTLTHQILLTRIFSVTSWYHFAFVAVSIAMFGMTVGAVIVFVRADLFTPDRVRLQLARVSLAYPILIVLTFLTQLSVPFTVHPSVVGLYSVTFTYAVIAVPFVASGICICLILTRFPQHVSQLYGADLVGAALGCVILVYLLPLTDGPTAMIGVAWLGSLAALAFASDSDAKRLRRLALVTSALLLVAFVGHTVLVWRQFPVLRILYTKGGFEARPLYERWNSYSRVQVSGDPNRQQPPFARSLSPTFPAGRSVRELRVDIDVNASTSLLHYSGNASDVDFLKYDVTNIGRYLRPSGSSLVVGTGGGRDMLAALIFGARSVTGVEINRQIIETVNGRFGDYGGHLDRDPRVRVVNDEARSYLARASDQFDFLQISLIDTWAATAAGAFVLSENSIYTTEAWQVFLTRLTDGGLLSVSRWYTEARPAEIYRLISLAATSLRSIGVANPREHIVLIRSRPIEGIGVGTLLVSRTPWASDDLARLHAEVARLEFETMLTPTVSVDAVFPQLTSQFAPKAFLESYPVDISAPTDDSPFFFQMLRLKDMLRLDLLGADKSTPNMQAVVVLGALLITVAGLSATCIVGPLLLMTGRRSFGGARLLVVYFAAIGLGFMLVETAIMQRMIVMLGHPTYGLSVVLFTLLLSSGCGSYLTHSIPDADLRSHGVGRLMALVGTLAITGLALSTVATHVAGATTPVRIGACVLLLFPSGLLMGMAFPVGMKLAVKVSPSLTAWLWGINGACSVCATVLAIAIALTTTISAAFWAGTSCYGAALMAFAWATRDGKTSSV